MYEVSVDPLPCNVSDQYDGTYQALANEIDAPSRRKARAVSAAIRPAPRIVPVAMPGRAAGRTTRRIVASFPLPRASEASRRSIGMASIDDCVARMIGGRASSDIMIPATMKERPSAFPDVVTSPERELSHDALK